MTGQAAALALEEDRQGSAPAPSFLSVLTCSLHLQLNPEDIPEPPKGQQALFPLFPASTGPFLLPDL